MAIDINGLAVLRLIVSDPEIFSDISAKMRDAAQKLVLEQLKAPSTNLGKIRGIYRLLGNDAFCIILEGMPTSSVKQLAIRLDGNDISLKAATTSEQRKCITRFASGAVDPRPDYSQFAKQLKTKGITLDDVKAICHEIGTLGFSAALELLTDANAKTLLKKLDKHNPEFAAGSPEQHRQIISELAQNIREPAQPGPIKKRRETKSLESPVKAPKFAKPPTQPPARPQPERAISSKAMKAVWDGKNRED